MVVIKYLDWVANYREKLEYSEEDIDNENLLIKIKEVEQGIKVLNRGGPIFAYLSYICLFTAPALYVISLVVAITNDCIWCLGTSLGALLTIGLSIFAFQAAMAGIWPAESVYGALDGLRKEQHDRTQVEMDI